MRERIELTEEQTRRLAEEMSGWEEPGYGRGIWSVLAFRPTGIHTDGPYSMTDAGRRRSHLPFPAYLLVTPYDPMLPFDLVMAEDHDGNSLGPCTMVLDVEDWEVVRGVIYRSSRIIATLEHHWEDGWRWREV